MRAAADRWQCCAGEAPWWTCSTEVGEEQYLTAFSTRRGGVSEGPFATLNLSLGVGDDPVRVDENRRRIRASLGIQNLPWWQPLQVHGSSIYWLRSPTEPVPAADGVLTRLPGVALSVLVADCIPLLVMVPEVGVAGAVHVGWRGLMAGIVDCLDAVLRQEAGVGLAAGWFLLGPSIGPCCYEVGWELGESCRQRWGAKVLRLGRPGQKPRLALPEALRRALLGRGAALDRVHLSGLCTACRPGDFYSYRRDGGRSGRQAGVVVRWS